MRVFDVEYDGNDPDWTVMQGVKRLMFFLQSISMPTSLRDLGINDKSVLDELAHRCAENNGGTVGRFAVLNEADIRNILDWAY